MCLDLVSERFQSILFQLFCCFCFCLFVVVDVVVVVLFTWGVILF